VADFAVQRVRTMRGEKPKEEWSLVCRDAAGDHRYVLCKAHAEALVGDLAWSYSQLYFGTQHSGCQLRDELGRVPGTEIPNLGASVGVDDLRLLVHRSDKPALDM
jgi:hypothetical protein